jgi:type IV pilus biogenesis protein CpaD/CtpE
MMLSVSRHPIPALPLALVALLVSTALALGGCRLVDQTSFGAAPRAPAPSELATALTADGAVPLLVMRPDDGVPYGDALRQAIQAAEVRDSNARFRLLSIVPAQGDLAAQQAALDANTAFAREMLVDMGAAGINSDRVTLLARTDAHVTRREIRLYRG